MSAPQSLLLGDFELNAKLGEGGMGAVYLARQISLGRQVAIKILPPKLAQNAELLERFKREARATAKLNHPNIIAGIDVGEANGYHYFAMEYVEGETLKSYLEREGTLKEGQACRVGAAIASALAHAHAAGIVHRDVKPENILLARDGTPKLADLGLATITSAKDASLTQSGTTVGTPYYIAPEQARAEKDIDGRADAYSLGCTLYHATTGRPPFDAASPALVMVKHLQEKMPHPQSINPELSDDFCRVLGRLVARNREDRYAEMENVHNDLQALFEGREPEVPALNVMKSNFTNSPKTVLRTSSHRNMRAAERDETPKDRVAGSTTRARKVGGLPPIMWVYIGGGAGAALLLLGLLLGRGDKTEPTPQSSNPPAPPPALPSAPPGAIPAAPPPPSAAPTTSPSSGASGGPSDDDFTRSIAKLPPDQQVKKVIDKLKELNPGYNGEMNYPPIIEGGEVTELSFESERLRNVTPVRALTGLRRLIFSAENRASPLIDVAPLRSLAKLEHFSLDCGPLRDLGQLRGLAFGSLTVDNNRELYDISGLKDWNVKNFQCSWTKVADLSPLRTQKDLQRLRIDGCPVTDLSPLEDLNSLHHLMMVTIQTDDLWVLRKLPALESLRLTFNRERDAGLLHSRACTLTKINDKPADEFWAEQGYQLLFGKTLGPLFKQCGGSFTVDTNRQQAVGKGDGTSNAYLGADMNIPAEFEELVLIEGDSRYHFGYDAGDSSTIFTHREAEGDLSLDCYRGGDTPAELGQSKSKIGKGQHAYRIVRLSNTTLLEVDGVLRVVTPSPSSSNGRELNFFAGTPGPVTFKHPLLRDLAGQPTPWMGLFNGLDTTGWRTDTPDSWSVQHGWIMSQPTDKNIFLSMDRVSGDFEWTFKASTKGIMKAGWTPDSPGTSNFLIVEAGKARISEYTVDKKGNTLVEGSLQTGGETHIYRIVVQGTRIEAFVDGHSIVSTNAGGTTKAKRTLILHSQQVPISYADIWLKDLSPRKK